MTTATVKVYEMGRSGGLVPVDESAGLGLELGAVVYWGGNMGWPETDYCVVSHDAFRRGYWLFDLDHPEKNSRLHFAEYHSIKREDDPSLWHRQHFFRTNESRTAEEVAAFNAEHDRQRLADEQAQAQAAAECARQIEAGRALWSRLMPADCSHVIIAELICDDSDIQTDYFAEHTERTIILAPSKHGRDNFAEMRKAALLLPETKHLGPACDEWRVMIKAAADDPHHRTWAGCLHDETGREWWPTEAEARAEMEKALAEDKAHETAQPFVPFCPRLPFGAELRSESIEHREKYTGGNGYYLQANRCNPWRVSKTRATGWQSSEISGDLLRALAQRHDHMEHSTKPAPSAPAAVKVTAATLTENTEKGGLEIRFPAKPAAEVLDALKAHGWRWSRFASCWWIKATAEARAFAATICV